MIIRILGNSGSGKTTAVRELMQLSKIPPIEAYNEGGRVEAYELALNVGKPTYVLGKYDNTCGGMDTISDWNDQLALIHRYALMGHVVYEGLLLSTYYGRMGINLHATYGREHLWAFIDTPIETCIERVKNRRLEAGNFKPLNEANTRARVKPIESLKRRLEAMYHNVVTVDHGFYLGEQIYNLLKRSA